MISKEYFKLLDSTYDQLHDCSDPKQVKQVWLNEKEKLSPWPDRILRACQPDTDPVILNELVDRAGKIGELLILDFAARSDSKFSEGYMDQLIETNKQLVLSGDVNAKKLAKGIIESMVVGLEALGADPNPLTQKIIDYLCDIVDINLGTYPKWRFYNKEYNKQELAEYSDLLNGVLYSAVVNFYKRLKVGTLYEEHIRLIKSINCPVISVGSRKGGTGKTLFTAAVLKWLKSIRKEIRICVIDFDLSGPVWQYFLFPKRNEPSVFLDNILPINQPVDKFSFPNGNMSNENLLSLVEQGKCSFIEGDNMIGHVGIHDIPSINRTIDLAVEFNRESFYPFLANLLSAISTKYDIIIIDNSPGFHSVPYSTLGIASSVKYGKSFILSTPSHPDLCGSFLELSEFKLTNIENAPVWIINKATEASLHFAQKPRTALEVAKELQAYDGALPKCPVLEKILIPDSLDNLWNFIRMDQDVSEFGFINSDGKPNLHTLSDTKYYKDVIKILNENIPIEWLNMKEEV